MQQILRDTVAGASESQAFMNNLYESGLTAKATLEYTGELNEKAKTALVKSFEEFGSGAKNTEKSCLFVGDETHTSRHQTDRFAVL